MPFTSPLSMDHARELANEISNTYFKAGIEPTETLMKIAQSEELTPDQIKLVATEANKLIHTHKYASTDDKYFAAEFPLADSKAAISQLQLDGDQVKVSAKFDEPKISFEGPDPFEMFGIKEEEFDKTAEVRGSLKKASYRNQLLNQKLEDKVFLLKEAEHSTERAFIKQARQLVLGGFGSKERMNILGFLDHFVKESSFTRSRPSLAKLAYVLGQEGLIEPRQTKAAMEYLTKEGDQKAPDEWISDKLKDQAQVINGEHPLYITLKTFDETAAHRSKYEERFNIVKDTGKEITQRIRAL